MDRTPNPEDHQEGAPRVSERHALAALTTARSAADVLVSCFGRRPDTVVILGSGLAPAADHIGHDSGVCVALGEVPGFAPFAAPGHRSEARLVTSGERAVLVVLGRSHLYEGRSPNQVVHTVRAAVLAGCQTVVLTNAAGAIDPELAVGELVLIADHIDLTGRPSPLTGLPTTSTPPSPTTDRACFPLDAGTGSLDVPQTPTSANATPTSAKEPAAVSPPRATPHALDANRAPVGGVTRVTARSSFVDMTDTWSPVLRSTAHRVRADLREGVYAQMGGPQLETPAEIRMLRALGADLVGMSTVTEAIAAKHLGAELLGISVVTNMAAGVSAGALAVGHMATAASAAAPGLGTLIAAVLANAG